MSSLHKLLKLAVINDHLVSLVPDSYSSKKELLDWLNTSPYSPYVSLYGGISSLTYDKKKSFISEIDNKPRYKLEDTFSFKFENFQNFGDCIYAANTKLADILNCNELFRAYPQFRDLDVAINISNANNGVISGTNYYNDDKIEIFADSNENAMRALLHELQHSIQVKEGFALGESYYQEEGVMNLFVGSIADEDENYQNGSFSDIATHKTMLEISDLSARIDLSNAYKAIEQINKEIETKIENLYKRVEDGTLDVDNLADLENKYLNMLHSKPNGVHSLGSILKHDELFSRYPFFSDINVHFDNSMELSKANYNALNQTISLSGWNTEDDIKSFIIHELQHVIQQEENWAKGGGVIEFMPENKKEILKELDDLEVALLLKNPKNSIEDVEILMGSSVSIRSQLISKKWEEQDIKAEIERLKVYANPIKSYSRLWGEQQARAAQQRINMSLEERLGEDWTKTLERVEGGYNEPIIKYDFTNIQQAIALEERYLNESGKLDESLILSDGVEKLPKYFTSYQKFENLFKNKISSRYALLETPIGDVKVNMKSAFNHFTNNSNKVNRIKYSGGFIPAFTDPLFVIKEKHEGKDTVVFYRPMISKKKQEGLMHFAGFAVNDKGEIENSTYFDISKGRLEKYIKTEEDNLLYFKHAGSRQSRARLDGEKTTKETRANDEILAKSKTIVNAGNTMGLKEHEKRSLQKALSIIPDNIPIDVAKNYLFFNGILQQTLEKSTYHDCFNGDTFSQPISFKKATFHKDSSYFSSGGEKEARRIEDLYLNENKVDEISLESLTKCFNRTCNDNTLKEILDIHHDKFSNSDKDTFFTLN